MVLQNADGANKRGAEEEWATVQLGGQAGKSISLAELYSDKQY
jgi:hypothetical protein